MADVANFASTSNTELCPLDRPLPTQNTPVLIRQYHQRWLPLILVLIQIPDNRIPVMRASQNLVLA